MDSPRIQGDVPGPMLDPSLPTGDRRESTDMAAVIDNAKAATDKDQRMSLLQGIKLYPKAVAWSVLISTCVAMEAYDISLINNFYGFPQFKEKYGQQMPDGSYEVTAPVRSSILLSKHSIEIARRNGNGY